MIISTFFISNKNDRDRFFEENFLLADINLNVIFEMLWLIISNADIDFQARDLQ